MKDSVGVWLKEEVWSRVLAIPRHRVTMQSNNKPVACYTCGVPHKYFRLYRSMRPIELDKLEEWGWRGEHLKCVDCEVKKRNEEWLRCMSGAEPSGRKLGSPRKVWRRRSGDALEETLGADKAKQ